MVPRNSDYQVHTLAGISKRDKKTCKDASLGGYTLTVAEKKPFGTLRRVCVISSVVLPVRFRFRVITGDRIK